MEAFELNIDNYSLPKNERHSRKSPKWNPIPIIGVKNGKLFPFPSCYHAARFLKAKNVHTMARNILKVCNGERKTIQGIKWFFERDHEKYIKLRLFE
jgi:hypothetical protein